MRSPLTEDTTMAVAAPSSEDAMLAKMEAAQKRAEAYQLQSTLLSLKHQTMMAIIQNIK